MLPCPVSQNSPPELPQACTETLQKHISVTPKQPEARKFLQCLPCEAFPFRECCSDFPEKDSTFALLPAKPAADII